MIRREFSASRPGAHRRIEALKQRLADEPAARFAAAIEKGETPKGGGACKGQVPLSALLASVPG